MSAESVDVRILQATFAARVQLAKKTEPEALADAHEEWVKTQKWVNSESHKDGSFLWFCEEFDLEPSAVRRAIKEKRK